MLDESILATIRKSTDQTNLAYAQTQLILRQFDNIKIDISNIILPDFSFSKRIKKNSHFLCSTAIFCFIKFISN